MVNIITEFPEVTEMADGIGLEYIGIFWGRVISSIVTGGRFRYGLTPSTGKALLNES